MTGISNSSLHLSVGVATAQEWDDVWRQCEYATYFHSRKWAELWRAVTGGRTRPGARKVTFSDGASAIVTLSLRRRFWGADTVAESSAMGTIGGWISTDALTTDHAAALASVVVDAAPSVAWRLNPFDPAAAALSLPGEADVTHAIELSPGFESLFRNWSKGHRAAVTQSEKAGVEIRKASSPDDWNVYYDVYEDSVRRWGQGVRVVHPATLFERLSQDRDDVCLWLATHEGRPVAGALCLYSRNHVVYWHGAALEAHFEKRPVNLLLYRAIRDACERGLRWFDFNPSGGHEGVMKFKKSFGATALSSPMIRKNSTVTKIALALKGSI